VLLGPANRKFEPARYSALAAFNTIQLDGCLTFVQLRVSAILQKEAINPQRVAHSWLIVGW